MATWLKGAVSSLGNRSPALSDAVTRAAQQLQTAAAAVSSSTTVQHLSDRLSGSHELAFAVERVHASVASARGPDRLALLQHWVQLLRDGHGEESAGEHTRRCAWRFLTRNSSPLTQTHAAPTRRPARASTRSARAAR